MDDKPDLTAARERVRSALENRDDVGNEELAAAAADLMDATERYIGECQLAVPFAEMFYVMDAQGLMLRCTHDPVHEVKP